MKGFRLLSQPLHVNREMRPVLVRSIPPNGRLDGVEYVGTRNASIYKSHTMLSDTHCYGPLITG